MDTADLIFEAPAQELYAFPPPPRRNARRARSFEVPVKASSEYEGLLVRTALVRSDKYRVGKFMPSLQSLSDVARLLAHLANANQEHIVTIPVNNQLVPLAVHETGIGTSRSALVAGTDVLRIVMLTSASAFIIAHNHPSGLPTPSEEDVQMMNALEKSASCLGLSLLDSIVIGYEGFMSVKTKSRGGWGEL